MSQNISGKNNEIRKEKASGRAEDYSKLTIPQRIAKLDTELGKGVGAAKQRARLADKLVALNTPIPKKLPQEDLAQEKSPKKYARKYSGKEKVSTK